MHAVFESTVAALYQNGFPHETKVQQIEASFVAGYLAGMPLSHSAHQSAALPAQAPRWPQASSVRSSPSRRTTWSAR